MNKAFLNFGILLGILLQVNVGIAQNCIYPGQTEMYIQYGQCSLDVEICLDIPFVSRNDFNIFLDGNLYSGTYAPCNYDTTSVYSVSDLVNFPDPNPDFVLDSLIINGTTHSFSFATVNDLVDSMNVRDPAGAWIFDVPTRTIRGGVVGSSYSWLYVKEINSSTVIQQRIDWFSLPNGLIINVPGGLYQLVIDEIATSCSDTLALEVFCVNSNTILDTIDLNQIDTVCFAMDNLRGAIQSISNICPSASGTNALIDIIPNTNCIEIAGVDLGLDFACLVLVDDLGLTDTIYYYLNVKLPDDPSFFSASDDFVSTNIDEPITFNPTSNDLIPGILDTIFISQSPNFGSATVYPDGTISYIPDLGYQSFGTPDSLEYTICIGFDCRSAIILLDVTVGQLEPMTAMTPNADGVNDVFVIQNIENYPDNELSIFNRWGNRVFHTVQYQNNWDGTWDQSSTLPDGIYFYILDIVIDGMPEQSAGYILIRR